MLCPFAVQRPVSAHGGAIGVILGAVEHVTAGEGDPYNEFANPANQVSSHFGILNGQGGTVDGELEQYVDTANASWAQAAGNLDYVSVETEGQPGEALTPAQVATFGRLMAWVHDVHGVPLVVTDTPGHAGLILHSDGGAAWGGHTSCPGVLRANQRPAILAAAGAVPPPGPTPTPLEDANMLTDDPTPPGNGSWALAPDGGIFTTDGALFFGAMAGNRWGWQQLGTLAGIAAWWDGKGWGYKVALHLNTGKAPDGSPFDYYRFPTNGSLRSAGAVRFEATDEGKAYLAAHPAA